jgi:hypothetical protein
VVVLSGLKQAAQDLGGQFTNNVNVSGQVTKTPMDLSHLDKQEKLALLELLDLTEGRNGNGKPSPRLIAKTPRKTSSI